MSTPLIDNLWRQFRQKWGNAKNLFPGESKTRKGGSGKSGVWKWKMKEWNIKKALTTDANIQCLPSTDTPSNGDLYPRTFQGSLLYKFYCPQPWFRYVSRRRSLQKSFFPCEYVAARATTCPIFQCFVCLCETSPSNCQSIMHFKHSYMHNHAFYVLIHPIILLYHTYMLHIQLSTAKFNASFHSPTSIPIMSTVKFEAISNLQCQS
jgi:hypothetical protein